MSGKIPVTIKLHNMTITTSVEVDPLQTGLIDTYMLPQQWESVDFEAVLEAAARWVQFNKLIAHNRITLDSDTKVTYDTTTGGSRCKPVSRAEGL